MRYLSLCTSAWLLSLAAFTPSCGDSDSQSSPSTACASALLEADLEPSPFMGPGVDASGSLMLEPGRDYVVSTTYGVPKLGADGKIPDTYITAFGAIQEQLRKEKGLVAYRFASSDACGSGRTLAVWSSEAQMYEFVTSPAHLNAMTNANALLEPGYGVTHYTATSANEITFMAAVPHLATHRR